MFCYEHIFGTESVMSSNTSVALFPGLPTIQFLIACIIQKLRGRPGPIYQVNDVSVYLGRQRVEGIPIERTHITHVFFVLNQEWCVFCLVKCSKLQHLRKKLQEKTSSLLFLPFLLEIFIDKQHRLWATVLR